MRIFLGGSKGLILFEDGERTVLSDEKVLAIAKLHDRVVAGNQKGHILVYDGNGDARIMAKDVGESVWGLAAAPKKVVFAGVSPAGAWISRDGAESWEELPSFGAADGAESWTAPWGTPLVSAIASHPRSTKTVYFGVEVGGLYRSRDSGKKWFDLELPHDDVHSVEVSPAKHDRVFVTTGGGAFSSDDEGFNWKPIGTTNPKQYTMGLAAHPVEADRVIVSAAIGPPPAWSSRKGVCDVYLSTDSGRRFRTVARDLRGGVGRRALTINPKVPSEVAFGTSNGELFYSNDGGESFDKVGGGLGELLAVTFA